MRLYFDCPIKALYMMKEFGVKFECKNSDEELSEYGLEEEDRFFEFNEAMCESEMIGDLLINFEDFRKIYVAKESESIFEPKENDFMTYQMPCSSPNVIRIDKEGIEVGWDKVANNVEIIMRDNKHFFAPLTEQD